MKLLLLSCVWAPLAFSFVQRFSPHPPVATGCHDGNVTYSGVYASENEVFFGIKYGQNTGGENRFKPPVPYVPPKNSVIEAVSPGFACPQEQEPPAIFPISEDCLALNVWRPNGTKAGDDLPVLVYIYGGGFDSGWKDDPLQLPGGMLMDSVANGHPIMHVELNYRLGVFGFAQAEALKEKRSLNAGLRDQRLAIEWVQANIARFGGNPDKITIHGQSSGGLAVGMQMMAYGASRPFPFHQGICESQALEPGITGHFTQTAMANTVANTTCNGTTPGSDAMISCLRKLPMEKLLNAQVNTASSDPSANLGDQWLPTVDGDFLPDAPSKLINQGRFANFTTMIGWCQDDAQIFVTPSNSTKETEEYYRAYLPGFSETQLQQFLALYPPSDFKTSHFLNGTVEQTAESYRSGRILRDILFTCQPLFYGQAIAKRGQNVYLYDQNQTMYTALYEQDYDDYGLGVTHGSELAFIFSNFSFFAVYDYPVFVTPSATALRHRESRSWSSFTALGQPSLPGHDTLSGWEPAEFEDENFGVFVIGGPNEGYSGTGATSVAAARAAVAIQKLQKRCRFLNSPDIIKALQF